MRWGISSMMKCLLKEQHCNSPKEKIPHFIWKYVKHSIIIVAVAHFEKNKVARYSYLTRKIHCMARNPAIRFFGVKWEKVFWKMRKNMWQEMGQNNGAPGGGEGERFWVSEKTEPVSFQPQSNNNNQKYQNSRAFQGNSPSPNDHSCIIFCWPGE